MRDLLITCLVFGSLPIILMRPYIGVLVWSWLSYMNPHRLAWGFAYDMPFAQIVAITLLLSIFFSKEKQSMPRDVLLWVWGLFIVWMLVSTVFSLIPESARFEFIKVLKIQLVTFLTILLINSRERMRQLIWVIVLSIGFFSTKGGLFTLLSGGSYRVWGPPESFIEENNGLALATLMIVPLMFFLWQSSHRRWIKYGLVIAMLLSLTSVLGSQSRGALLAIIAVAGFFWLKTPAKLLSGLGIVLFALLAWQFMPESWHVRMESIQHYEQDASAMGRINAWHYSVNVANDRLSGAGMNSWSLNTFAIYAPEPLDVHAAHSIFFSVLADHGWPGLLLFVLILWLTWRNLAGVIKINQARNYANARESLQLAKMIQISLIAYMSGGAFLSLSYFDLPWHLIAIALLLNQQQQQPLIGDKRLLKRYRRQALIELPKKNTQLQVQKI